MQPLAGVRILDFSTLVPGPLATLILAEAGAEVIKVEKPHGGDDMRLYGPSFGESTGNFALLNRGKNSITADLKDPLQRDDVRRLAVTCDVVVEQFRPGVMDRLGLGYETLCADNPKLVYCAITGYGQKGEQAGRAGHDLSYLAETGILSLAADGDGQPLLPPLLMADIGGGALPAVINILLGLQQVRATGQGAKLDVSMTANMYPWLYWALALHHGGRSPEPGGEMVTGGSPRYRIYRTADDRFLAAAPLEDKFWQRFCAAIELEESLRDDAVDPAATTVAVAATIRQRESDHWRDAFAGMDVCCSVVATLEEALSEPHFYNDAVTGHEVSGADGSMPALPVPIDAAFRRPPDNARHPEKPGDLASVWGSAGGWGDEERPRSVR